MKNFSKPHQQIHLLIFLLCLSSSGNIATGQDWPQFRGPEANGKIDSGTLDLGTGKLELHWKVPCNLGFSSISVAGDKAVTIVSRDEQEVCIALDAATGKEVWSHVLGSFDFASGAGNAGAQGNKGGDGSRSTPAISDNNVFVYDAHLKLHCLDLASGKLKWARDIQSEFGGENIKWHNATSPLVDKSNVYVAGGGDGQAFLAFDKSNGKLKWKTGSEKLTHASPALATMDAQSQVIFFVQSGLVAVDRENGQELWRTPFPFNVSTAASPVVTGNDVYCSAGYGVGAGMYKVEAGKAVEVWRRPNRLINHWSSPLVHEKHLYGLYGFKRYGKAPLQCVEFATGEVKWKEAGFGPGNCILIGDKLIVLADDGEMAIAIATPEKYDELWKGNVLDGKCWSTPAFSNGKIFIRSTKEAACVSFE